MPPKTTLSKPRSNAEEMLALHIKAYKLPTPHREFKFIWDRKFRFDFAWPGLQIAAEVEGGSWSGGRHSRGEGFERDCVKYNYAAFLGWKVFRFTPAMIERGEAIKTLERCF